MFHPVIPSSSHQIGSAAVVATPPKWPTQGTAEVAAGMNPVITGRGDWIRTHDFNLGNIRLAPNTIREIQQHQPHRVPWRCLPSRGVLWKVEG